MRVFPKVGIIVLNYNGKSCLLSCLLSLQRLDYSEKDIIIVDNASTDGSLETAKQAFPLFTYVRSKKNEGFAKGMNKGIRLALERGARWVWLFNYDAEARPDALTRLIEATGGNPSSGLLSPVISGESDRGIWFARGDISYARMRTRHLPATREELAKDFYPSEFLTGCALLIKKEVIEAIGFLDERFFLYYEDADYCVRARRFGFRLLVVPGAQVSHREKSLENPAKLYFLVRSGLIFFEKWAPPHMRLYLWAYVRMRRVKNLFKRLGSNDSAHREVQRAYRDYFHER